MMLFIVLLGTFVLDLKDVKDALMKFLHNCNVTNVLISIFSKSCTEV